MKQGDLQPSQSSCNIPFLTEEQRRVPLSLVCASGVTFLNPFFTGRYDLIL
jgi:hypothetical protein